MATIKFKNVEFRGLTRKILLEEDTKLKIIITVNAEFIVTANKDEEFNKIICENYGTFDGQIPFLLAKLKFPKDEFEKISGSDFIYDICAFAKDNNKKVYLLGGYADSNSNAVNILKKRYQIGIAGMSPEHKSYPFDARHDEFLLQHICEFKPDFLLVAFGAKKQEMWINQHKEELSAIGVRWAIGVGGAFEFVSGSIKRAPIWIQRIGLEGVYRAFQEPKMFRIKRLISSLAIFKIR